MSEDIKNQAAQMLRRIDNPTLQGQVTKIQNEDPMEELKKDYPIQKGIILYDDPISIINNNDMFIHFLRGYIDGDGSYVVDNKQYKI